MLGAKRIRQTLDYDADTGVFYWKEKISSKVVVGKPAGRRHNGYVAIGLFGKRYFAHRLAWVHVYGRWPKAEIDHINSNPSDNRIDNLREASRSQNGYHKPFKLPVRGVRFDTKRNKWHAQIRINTKVINLGRYKTQAEAAAIRAEVARQAFGEFHYDGQ